MTGDIQEELRAQKERQRQWEALTPAERKRQLFLRQKELLGAFLERHAISQAQYDESMRAMTAAMAVAG